MQANVILFIIELYLSLIYYFRIKINLYERICYYPIRLGIA